jgi:hypothetical protein
MAFPGWFDWGKHRSKPRIYLVDTLAKTRREQEKARLERISTYTSCTLSHDSTFAIPSYIYTWDHC